MGIVLENGSQVSFRKLNLLNFTKLVTIVTGIYVVIGGKNLAEGI